MEAVALWHEALNSGDADRLVELSHPEIEMGGPRGPARGEAVLREWVERANVKLEPTRLFQNAERVVAEQRAEWRDGETGEVTGTRTVASVFVVRDGRVKRVSRYETLAEALGAAGLDE